MSFLILGIAFHTTVGAALARLLYTKWSAVYISLIFLAKEFGELKYKIPGSIKTWDKNWEIIQTLFTDFSILPQWLLPAIAARFVYLYLKKRDIDKS